MGLWSMTHARVRPLGEMNLRPWQQQRLRPLLSDSQEGWCWRLLFWLLFQAVASALCNSKLPDSPLAVRRHDALRARRAFG